MILDTIKQRWEECWFTLRRNLDGKTVEYQSTWWGDTSAYYWQEGNASCDCNRRQFFSEVTGEPIPEDADDCGNSEYDLLSVRFPNGESYEWAKVVEAKALLDTI